MEQAANLCFPVTTSNRTDNEQQPANRPNKPPALALF
jgi:hypothetical protein